MSQKANTPTIANYSLLPLKPDTSLTLATLATCPARAKNLALLPLRHLNASQPPPVLKHIVYRLSPKYGVSCLFQAFTRANSKDIEEAWLLCNELNHALIGETPVNQGGLLANPNSRLRFLRACDEGGARRGGRGGGVRRKVVRLVALKGLKLGQDRHAALSRRDTFCNRNKSMWFFAVLHDASTKKKRK